MLNCKLGRFHEAEVAKESSARRGNSGSKTQRRIMEYWSMHCIAMVGNQRVQLNVNLNAKC